MTPIRLRVAELREAKGWNQSKFARLTGIRRATIAAIEAGKTTAVDFAILERIAETLGVNAAFLIEHEPEAAPPPLGRAAEPAPGYVAAKPAAQPAKSAKRSPRSKRG